MRIALALVVAACFSACRHAGAGASDQGPGAAVPAPDLTADVLKLYLPDGVETVWAFEVRPSSEEADRFLGSFRPPSLLARLPQLRREACARGARLLIAARGPGGWLTREVRFGGVLEVVRFVHARQRWEGAEFPCD